MEAIDYIDTAAGVERLFDGLPPGDYLAVDTEFVREKTYFPRPCLLQLARGDKVACLDLLVDEVVEALRDPLSDDGVVKVLHSARQDLEVFHGLWGRIPAPVFDTQIAGALIGLPEQCGYGQAVEQLVGVSLGKGHARTDWSRRPLSQAQLNYAADDVRYLVPLYHELTERLAARGRTEWPADDFAALIRPELYEPDPGSAWRRVKNGRQLEGAALARLQAVAAWRERVAVERNRPRRWILADDALLELARHNPQSKAALETCPSLPPAVRRRYADELLRLLGEIPDDAPPPATGPDMRMTRGEIKLARRLGKIVDACSDQHEVAASMLSPRADLKRLVLGERSLPVLAGWRRELVGERLVEAVTEATQDEPANGASASSS